MSDSGGSGTPPAGLAEGADPGAGIEALRARGAARFDPVGFRFIEALARRAAAHRDEARRILDRRLAEAISDYGQRLDRAQRAAGDALARGTKQFPEAADELRQHGEACDFGGLRCLLAKLEVQAGGGPLAELLAQIDRPAPTDTGAGAARATAAPAGPRGGLRSLAYFRSTWSRLSVDRRLSRAYAQAPGNAGPLNAHFLVLQALRRIREISPEYLVQFLSYADALLWLDQAQSGRSPAPKKASRGEGDKRKSNRGKAG